MTPSVEEPALESSGGSTEPVRLGLLTVMAGLGASMAALIVVAFLMPESYSVVEHSTSESAAQGVDGAWVARLGFLLFGLSVVSLAQLLRGTWEIGSRVLFTFFGVLMISAAAFSARSWEASASFDQTEDLLHSIAATGMGFAFALGVLTVIVQRAQSEERAQVLSMVAVAASVLLPLGMALWDGATGLLQRTMFLIAYAWFARETLRGLNITATSIQIQPSGGSQVAGP